MAWLPGSQAAKQTGILSYWQAGRILLASEAAPQLPVLLHIAVQLQNSYVYSGSFSTDLL